MTIHPQLLRLNQVRERTGLSPSTIWRKEKAGTFPLRLQIGPATVAWSEAEISNWIMEQIAARDGAPEAVSTATVSS